MLAEIIVRFKYDAHRWRNLATLLTQLLFFFSVAYLFPYLDCFGLIGSLWGGFWAGLFAIWKSPLEKRKWFIGVLVIVKLISVAMLLLYFIPALLVLFLVKNFGSSCYPNGVCVYLNPTVRLSLTHSNSLIYSLGKTVVNKTLVFYSKISPRGSIFSLIFLKSLNFG
jgi:hypothetical protein